MTSRPIENLKGAPERRSLTSFGYFDNITIIMLLTLIENDDRLRANLLTDAWFTALDMVRAQ